MVKAETVRGRFKFTKAYIFPFEVDTTVLTKAGQK